MKKILSMILAIAMVLTTLGSVAFAEETAVPAATCTCSTDTTWDGTVCDHWYVDGVTEYDISTPAQLAGLAKIMNDNTNDINFSGVKFTLTNDIDLNNLPWAPIGRGDIDRGSFYGSFDGGNHVISNLKVDTNWTCAGLFGQLAGNYTSVIENVILQNVDVRSSVNTSKTRTGALIGRADKAIVNNCKVIGTIDVSGYSFVGGLIGHSYAQITNCAIEATGKVNANNWQCGGLVGAHYSNNTSKVENCSVEGTNGDLEVVSYNGGIGGVVGTLSYDPGVVAHGLNSLSASNVTITTAVPSYGVGYVASGAVADNSSLENVTLYKSNGEEIKSDEGELVVSIGNKAFYSLQAALNAAEDGDTVNVISDICFNNGHIYSSDYVCANLYTGDKSFVIDLGGHTLTNVAPVNNNIFRFRNYGSVDNEITLKNGIIDSTGVWNPIDVGGNDASATTTLNLENLTVKGDKTGYSYSVFATKNGIVNATNVTIDSKYSCGFVSAGQMTLTDCNVNISGVSNLSAAVAVHSGGTLTVNSGTYATAPIGEADGGRGSWCAGVMNSGGTLVIKDGEFSNGYLGKGTLTTTDVYTVLFCDSVAGATSTIEIYDGTFNAYEECGLLHWNSSYPNGASSVVLSGGTYNVDPINGMTSMINVADGFKLTQYADGSYTVVDAAYIDVNEIDVTLKEASVKEGEVVYDIVLTAADSKVINRLNSADLSFVLKQDTGDNKYEIIASNDEVTINEVAEGRYEFHYAGKDDADTDTATSITIGQVKFTGVGKFSFAVDTNANETNAVHATEILDSIVDTFIPGGNVANGEGVLTLINATTGELTMEVPVRDLEVQIDFNNAANKNSVDYQDMTVVVSGSDIEDIEIKLGNTDVVYDLDIYGKSKAQYKIDTNADNKYVVTVANALTSEGTYTVTVKGAGYRTVRKNVTMNEDATVDNIVKFWNNVKDAEGADYLAGDIVKDNTINVYDLSAVVSYFGRTNDTSAYSKYARYDLNRDGKIDSKDVAYVLVSWGK